MKKWIEKDIVDMLEKYKDEYTYMKITEPGGDYDTNNIVLYTTGGDRLYIFGCNDNDLITNGASADIDYVVLQDQSGYGLSSSVEETGILYGKLLTMLNKHYSVQTKQNN